MSSTAKSIWYFGIYLLLAGLALFAVPNRVLALLGMQGTTEPWIRLAGTLTFILGIFFMYTARKEVRPFFYISMFGRGIFVAAVLGLVASGKAPAPLMLFALADVLGLLWTFFAYRKG